MNDVTLDWPLLSRAVAEELRRHWWLAAIAALLLSALNAWCDHVDPSGRAGIYAGFITTATQLGVTTHALKAWGFATGRGRFLPFIGLSIMSTIGVGLATLALILPGLWLYARWFLAVPIFIAEEEGAASSLGASFERTDGSAWPLAVIALFVGVLAFAPLFVAAFVVGDEAMPLWLSLSTYFTMFGGLALGWLAAVAAYRAQTRDVHSLEEIFA